MAGLETSGLGRNTVKIDGPQDLDRSLVLRRPGNTASAAKKGAQQVMKYYVQFIVDRAEENK